MDDLLFVDFVLVSVFGMMLNGGLNFLFVFGNVLSFWGMNINGDEFGLCGEIIVLGLSSGIVLLGNVIVWYDNLLCFFQFVDWDLGGSVEVMIKGCYVLLGKFFDVDMQILGNDICVGQVNVDWLLDGILCIDFSVKCDISGIQLCCLMVNVQNLMVEVQGFFSIWVSDLMVIIIMFDLFVVDLKYVGGICIDVYLIGVLGVCKLVLNGDVIDLKIGMFEVDGVFSGEMCFVIEFLEKGGVYELQKFDLVNL